MTRMRPRDFPWWCMACDAEVRVRKPRTPCPACGVVAPICSHSRAERDRMAAGEVAR